MGVERIIHGISMEDSWNIHGILVDYEWNLGINTDVAPRLTSSGYEDKVHVITPINIYCS
jgi:hypothetical protein